MFTNEVLVVIISLSSCFVTYILFILYKNIKECISLYKQLLITMEKNYNFLDEKFSNQIKNIRNNDDIDLVRMKNDLDKMKKVYDEIDNNGLIEHIIEDNEYITELNDFDIKDKINNLEYIVEKWQDVDDIETNITDLNDRVDELNENMSKFLLEDDVIELMTEQGAIDETRDKRINQMEKFITSLKNSLQDWDNDE
jgi:hypothetical protein